jgi:DNA-binding NtrC family response regulator
MAGEGAPGRRVLVIDDEDTVRSMLSRALALWGFEAVAVGTGEDGVRLLDGGERFACALLDLTMPGLSGEATLREMERLAPGMPIALMSGYQRDDLIAAGRHFLSKPFDLEALRDLVQALVRG